MSGAVVVGGEKRLLIENEKGVVISDPLIEVRVKVIEAVAMLPTHVPPTTDPERAEHDRAEARGKLWDVEIS